MTKIITVKDGFVQIDDFRDIIDVDNIVYYSLKSKKDGTILLKFYDKKKLLVRPYEQE